jgi:hypothetical protein
MNMCMEAMLGISLYSYLHLKLTKMLCLSYISYVFFQQNQQEGGTGSAWKQGMRGTEKGGR